MKASALLGQSQKLLSEAGIETARLDALVLIEDVMEIDRARILAEPDRDVSIAQEAKLKKLLKRRASHEPLAYIRGHSEFYGRDFVINHQVLVPRPESEAIIDLLKDILGKTSPKQTEGIDSIKKAIHAKNTIKIADIGTGSGVLGITASQELIGHENLLVELIDIDQNALEVAKTNVDILATSVNTVLSDLLEDTGTEYDIILANLPYVPDEKPINMSAEQEPRVALFGGQDGLDIYRRLVKQLAVDTNRPLLLIFEAFPEQHEELTLMVREIGYKPLKSIDFAIAYGLLS